MHNELEGFSISKMTPVGYLGTLESLDGLDIFGSLALCSHSISSTFYTSFCSSEMGVS